VEDKVFVVKNAVLLTYITRYSYGAGELAWW